MSSITETSSVALPAPTTSFKKISNSFQNVSLSIKNISERFFNYLASFFPAKKANTALQLPVETPLFIEFPINLVGLINYTKLTYRSFPRPEEALFNKYTISEIERKAIEEIVGEQEFNRVQCEINDCLKNGIACTVNYRINQNQVDDLSKNLPKIMLRILQTKIDDRVAYELDATDYINIKKTFIKRYSTYLDKQQG
jgi:hypothetical protein